MTINLVLIAIASFIALVVLFILYQQSLSTERTTRLETLLNHFRERDDNKEQTLQKLAIELNNKQESLKAAITQHLLQSLQTQQDSFQKYMQDIRQQVTLTLNNNAEFLANNFTKLAEKTDSTLKTISQEVDQRLATSFEKTTATFTDIIKRLALIDEAQKRMTELSGQVVSLQTILTDKRSRGALGEVQLSALISNMMPENTFALQHTLTNGKRVDCLLFLPEPTGNIAIDAKFPLESYQRFTDTRLSEPERKAAQQQFRTDIRKHIQDIANKYILPGETAEGAMMFIPSEAIFAEIHGHHPELILESQKQRVWMVSPTTMMAVLTTARAVLKDTATRKQIHIIQAHLSHLAKDFERFQHRMHNLTRHIDQVHADVKDVKISADKITTRFVKIEKAELTELTEAAELGT